MAKQKKPVHRVQMTEGKRNIIHQLLEEYDIQTVRGKVILQPHGKEFFTWYSKHLFTLHGKHFFT